MLSLIAAATGSCTVLQPPVWPPAVPREKMHHISGAGIEIHAIPIQKWEDYWELFDDNLPEIGLLAVWVELRNTRSQEIDLSRLKWELRRGGMRIRAATIDEVFKQYYRRRHVRFYSMNADQNARAAMSKWFLQAHRLGPLQSRQGFLLFKTNSMQGPAWSRDSVLAAQGTPITSGERNERRTLELPLFHANP